MMSEITITSFVDYEDKVGNLELIPRGPDARNVNHWDVKRWWYHGRTVYEACARINNTDNNDVIYVASSTNFPYLKIEYNGGAYTFDGDYKRAYIDRILIVNGSEETDVPIPLRGPIVSEVNVPFEVAQNGGANWPAGNVFEIGQTVTAKTAAFTGGIDPVIYRYRWQTRATSSDAWTNSAWTNTTNAKHDASIELTSAGQIRFQSQARDATSTNVNSFTGVKTIT
tara:strand:- start:577 stop:1254 length:678 start_codon:yes stop_codon:yes gene_type:complete